MPEICSRIRAIVRGLPRYYTGEPCKHGHISERYVSGSCVECTVGKSKERERRLTENGARRKKSICLFPGCNKIVDSNRNGKQKFCSNNHMKKFSSLALSEIRRNRKLGTICQLKGCDKDISDKKRGAKYCCVSHWKADKKVRRYKHHGRYFEIQIKYPKPDKCENPFCKSGLEPQFDHCHDLLYHRGWLCEPCNQSLGKLKDSPESLRWLADYLETR